MILLLFIKEQVLNGLNLAAHLNRLYVGVASIYFLCHAYAYWLKYGAVCLDGPHYWSFLLLFLLCLYHGVMFYFACSYLFYDKKKLDSRSYYEIVVNPFCQFIIDFIRSDKKHLTWWQVIKSFVIVCFNNTLLSTLRLFFAVFYTVGFTRFGRLLMVVSIFILNFRDAFTMTDIWWMSVMVTPVLFCAAGLCLSLAAYMEKLRPYLISAIGLNSYYVYVGNTPGHKSLFSVFAGASAVILAVVGVKQFDQSHLNNIRHENAQFASRVWQNYKKECFEAHKEPDLEYYKFLQDKYAVIKVDTGKDFMDAWKTMRETVFKAQNDLE